MDTTAAAQKEPRADPSSAAATPKRSWKRCTAAWAKPRCAAAARAPACWLVLNIFHGAVHFVPPLLYAVSVSLMPGSELFTMEMNLLPKHPDASNYLRAWTQVPLVRFI